MQEGIYEAFATRLAQAIEGLKMGDGMEEGVMQGPLIDEAAVCKVEELIGDALEQGARLITGGKRHGRGGTWFQPTLLAGLSPEMKIAREEIFGPVAPLFRFRDEAEAIRIANDTEFGLAGAVFTRDLARGHRVAGALQAGTCWINTYNLTPVEMPFGGVKHSGVGRENARAAIEHYSQLKSVYVAMGGVAAPF